LDFAKAFDFVNWGSLLHILACRGFPSTWCAWIQNILTTSKSAVLLNGCPGRWFTCKQGLRQGDPLSPYLFLLVADVLQQLIRFDGGVHHPATDSASCPVLYYADDTLKAASEDVERLKLLLDQFAAATGLKINFHKSTVVPRHVSPDDLPPLLSTLGCRQESFPQSYLGIPLSNVKLNLKAFAPLIARADRYLGGWQASLLNAMGRTVLANAVLDSSMIYIMSALLLPQGTIDALDKRRRAFLWSGEQTTSGAQCLIAWERACLPKKQGGLGVKDLKTLNQCLLLKSLTGYIVLAILIQSSSFAIYDCPFDHRTVGPPYYHHTVGLTILPSPTVFLKCLVGDITIASPSSWPPAPVTCSAASEHGRTGNAKKGVP
jgi:hypothetical protein